MNKFWRKATAVVATVAMVASLGAPAFAAEDVTVSGNELSEEAVAFLQEHNVDTSIFEISTLSLDEETQIANSYDESVLALKDAAAANNFTDEQIQKYVEGLVSTPTTVAPNDGISTLAVDRPYDNGIGYEVKSNAGYYQETAFATLPTVNRAASSGTYSDAYMFYTVSGPKWGIDVGLAYCSGGGVEAWRGCYTPQGQLMQTKNLSSTLKSGDRVYFNAVVETNGYLRFRVLDASDFSVVHYDLAYYVGDQGIYRSNAAFNRQISLCNGAKNFNTGAYMRNAQFSNAYIYASSGYSQTVASNTEANRRGVFGTNSTNRNQVTVNSYSPWYAENVSINF